MKITCHACDAKYTIADEKVSGRTVKIKCKKCGATIVVNADPAAAAAPAATGAPTGYEPAPPAGGDDDSLMATRVVGQDGAPPGITAAEWTVSLGEEERQMSQLQMAEEMQRGAITGDTYVWKDGMGDWLSVAQVPELAALLARAVPQQAYAPPPAAPVQEEPHMGLAGTMVMSEAPAPSPYAAPRPAAGAPAAVATPTPAPAATGGLAPVNQATTGAAARRANRPAGGSVDVFAAAAEKQPENRPENRPKPPTPAGRLGERNENSVLFSLSALTATESAAAKGSSDDAVVDFGLGNGKAKSAVDDLMSIGGGAIGGPMLAPPPLLAPVVEPPPAPAPVAMAMPSVAPSMGPGATFEPMPQKKSKTGLIIGVVVGVVALGAIGAVVAMGGGGAPSGETANTASAATVTTTTAPAVTSAPTATEAPVASSAPAASSGAVAVNDSSGKAPPSSGAGGPGTSTKSSGTATAAPTASAAPTPSATASSAPTATDTGGGGRDFNKGAATAALAAAAGAAKGCKQPGGPTGSASVRVVFAPSGNVTSANVQGPPFAGTPVGGCIASAFRGAHVPPFDGSPVAVSKTVNIN